MRYKRKKKRPEKPWTQPNVVDLVSPDFLPLPAPLRATLAPDPPGQGRLSAAGSRSSTLSRFQIRFQTPAPRPPPQRLLLGAQVCETLSLARLGWLPALCLRAGPSLARQHEWQSPAGWGSDGSGGGGRLAGQKQYFGGPSGRALRGCHHHHSLRVSSRVPASAAERPSPAAPSISTVVASRDWPVTRDSQPISAPIG